MDIMRLPIQRQNIAKVVNENRVEMKIDKTARFRGKTWHRVVDDVWRGGGFVSHDD